METISTLFLFNANCVAREQEVVVFPTPPFPPTKILSFIPFLHFKPLNSLTIYDMIQSRFRNINFGLHYAFYYCWQVNTITAVSFIQLITCCFVVIYSRIEWIWQKINNKDVWQRWNNDNQITASKDNLSKNDYKQSVQSFHHIWWLRRNEGPDPHFQYHGE